MGGIPLRARTSILAVTVFGVGIALQSFGHGPAVSSTAATTRTEAGHVPRVVDEETIEVRIGSETYRVRYIGTDTPEVGDPLGAGATAKHREPVEDQRVMLVKDVCETDCYARLLRYVFVGDTLVYNELAAEGYALALTHPP